MTPARLRKGLAVVKAAVAREISGNASSGRLGGAMAAEGYAGGYLQALRDFEAVLGNVPPSNSRCASAWDEVLK